MSRVRLAAQLQAAVLAYARAHPDEVLTSLLVSDLAAVRELRPAAHHVQQALQSLVHIRLLERFPYNDGTRAKHGFHLVQSERERARRLLERPTEFAHQVVPEPAQLPTDVRLDVLRDSGRLRLTYKGLVLEVGVVGS